MDFSPVQQCWWNTVIIQDAEVTFVLYLVVLPDKFTCQSSGWALWLWVLSMKKRESWGWGTNKNKTKWRPPVKLKISGDRRWLSLADFQNCRDQPSSGRESPPSKAKTSCSRVRKKFAVCPFCPRTLEIMNFSSSWKSSLCPIFPFRGNRFPSSECHPPVNSEGERVPGGRQPSRSRLLENGLLFQTF